MVSGCLPSQSLAFVDLLGALGAKVSKQSIGRDVIFFLNLNNTALDGTQPDAPSWSLRGHHSHTH